MRRTASIVVLSVLMLATVAVGPVGAAAEGLPFKAKATVVSADDVDDCGPGFAGTEVVYTGTGTHLGRFTMIELICLDMRDFDPSQGKFIIPFDVFGTYYAANDDELDFYVEGIFNAATLEVEDGGFDFTGGTGRFESAEGHGETILLRDDQGTLVGSRSKGYITYDASDRRK